jgi:cell division protein FtsB
LRWPLVLDSKDDSVPALLEFRLQARMLLHNQTIEIRALKAENEQLKAEKAELELRIENGSSGGREDLK